MTGTVLCSSVIDASVIYQLAAYATTTNMQDWLKSVDDELANYIIAQYGNLWVSPEIESGINDADLSASTWVSFTGYKYGNKWTKMYNVLTADYDPISNYDMTEKSVDGAAKDKSETTTNGSYTDSGATTYADSTTTNTVNTYDGGVELRTDQTTVNPSDITNTDNTRSYDDYGTTENPTNSLESAITVNDESLANQHEIHSHIMTRSGNIGVTTTQQMIESEMLLRNKYVLFNIIAHDIAYEISAGVWVTSDDD